MKSYSKGYVLYSTTNYFYSTSTYMNKKENQHIGGSHLEFVVPSFLTYHKKP
jgi:hypothetical protein